MNLRVASLVVTFFLVASAALAVAPGRPCGRVEVTADSAAAPTSRSQRSASVPVEPSFSVTSILDLTFTALLRGRPAGEHLIELRVFTPDAHLYRSLALPVAGRVEPGATHSVQGYARPLPRQQLTRVARGRQAYAAASTTLPVAGTDIVSSGLYGRWRVEAYLDGAEETCAPATWFTLAP